MYLNNCPPSREKGIKNDCVITTNEEEEKDTEKKKIQFPSYNRLKDVLISILIKLK